MFTNVHIDDILLVGSTEDCEWFESESNKVLKMKKDGPCGVGDDQTIMYLKRELEFRNNEFYLRTNRKYIPKLVEMMEVAERRNKTLPYHPGLDTYDPKAVDEKELLGEESAKKFRSGSGICLGIHPVCSENPIVVYVKTDKECLQWTTEVGMLS